MADLRKSGVFGSKTSCMSSGANKNLDEMRQRRTERLSAQTSEDGEQDQHADWQHTHQTETVNIQSTPATGAEKCHGQGQSRIEADDFVEQRSEGDSVTEQAWRKKKMEYSRLSPFQRRQRKQQELNQALQSFRSDVLQIARTKHSPY